jgi:methyltransferase (TIGR00027 family)
MTKGQTSTTAKGIAALRALETEKGPDRAICRDPLARRFTTTPFFLLSRWFSGYGERRAPGTQGFIVCRCRYFDDYLDARLRSGTRQVVILGAGLDSRAYRPERIGKPVRFFELDHPATQAAKTRRVREVIGELPGHVTYVPIDFNEETLDKMALYGFSSKLTTLFAWEGVTYYLTAEAVDATLAWIAAHSARGSAVIFDYIHRSALTASEQRGEVKRMQRYSRFTGEKLTFGIERGQIDAFLRARRFRNVVDVDAETLQKQYCVGPNSGRTVAEAYSIAHAEV